MAYSTATVMAIGGSPKPIIILAKIFSGDNTGFKKVLNAISNTGKKVVKMLLNQPGSSSSGKLFAAKVSGGLLVYFFTVVANRGPAIITVGMATTMPYNNVSPMSALNCFTNAVGAGCGGRKPCVTDKAATIGSPMYMADMLYCFENT